MTLAAVGFVLPAAILSAVGPMIVRATLTDVQTSGSIVGRLSAIGTVGAITGTFLTGFVLLGLVPTRVLIVGVGGLLVVVGLALTVALGRGGGGRPRTGVVALAAVAMGGLALAGPSPCDTESAYYCIAVEVDPARPGRPGPHPGPAVARLCRPGRSDEPQVRVRAALLRRRRAVPGRVGQAGRRAPRRWWRASRSRATSRRRGRWPRRRCWSSIRGCWRSPRSSSGSRPATRSGSSSATRGCRSSGCPTTASTSSSGTRSAGWPCRGTSRRPSSSRRSSGCCARAGCT